MYSSSKESGTPLPDAGKYIRIGIVALIAIIAFALVGGQAVLFFMNVEEFADLFITPLYFALVSSIILSVIALIRVNIVKRHSILWYSLSTAIGFINRNPTSAVTETITSFHDYKLSVPHFVIWQFTKVVLFGAFFANIMFGFAAMYVIDGNSLGIENIPEIFSLPFVTPPTDYSYATEKVVPMIPALLILVPSILGVIGLRLLLFVGLHHIFKVATSYIHDAAQGKPKWLNYTSSLEAIVGIGIIWSAFNMFFGENIDYNTKYAIGGTFVVGFALIAFSIFDRIRSRILTHMLKRDVYIRIFTIIAIAVIVGIAMSVNTSIADAKKIEYLGPYTAQQIGVNQYLAELDQIEEHIHDPSIKSISPNQIDQYIEDNADVLDGIRVWDWEAAFAKLKPEIGLIPYVNFEDNDRTVLSLRPYLSPIHVGVLSLVKKDGLAEKTDEIYLKIKRKYDVFLDHSGAIGRRYRRLDEVGAPYAITIDHQTLQDDTVTLRMRDSMEQNRIKVSELDEILSKETAFP